MLFSFFIYRSTNITRFLNRTTTRTSFLFLLLFPLLHLTIVPIPHYAIFACFFFFVLFVITITTIDISLCKINHSFLYQFLSLYFHSLKSFVLNSTNYPAVFHFTFFFFASNNQSTPSNRLDVSVNYLFFSILYSMRHVES